MTWTIIVGAACNLACSLLGVQLVLRRQSLVGDAISHAVLPGLAVAFLLTGSLTGPAMFVGAALMGLLTVFLSRAVQRATGVSEDAGLGVVFTALFALGVILVRRFASRADLDPGCVLYGLIEAAPVNTEPFFGVEIPRALFSLVPALAAVILFLAAFRKELLLSAFDSGLADAMGFSSSAIYYALMALVSVVTVAAFEAVGSILVVAMLIVPAATAQLLTDDYRRMHAWSALVGTVSAVGGTVWATSLNTSVAGMMAVVSGLCFAAAVVASPTHGVAARIGRNVRLRMRILREDVLGRLYRSEEAGAVADLPRGVASSAAVWGLRRRGLVTGTPPALTDAGRRRGASLVRAHRLWESYLRNELDLPLDHLHDPAEVMEHFLDEELQARLMRALDAPAEDPHGSKIP